MDHLKEILIRPLIRVYRRHPSGQILVQMDEPVALEPDADDDDHEPIRKLVDRFELEGEIALNLLGEVVEFLDYEVFTGKRSSEDAQKISRLAKIDLQRLLVARCLHAVPARVPVLRRPLRIATARLEDGGEDVGHAPRAVANNAQFFARRDVLLPQ